MLSSPAYLNLLGRFILHPWGGNDAPRGPRNGVCGSSFNAFPPPHFTFSKDKPYGLDCKMILLLDYRKRRYYHKHEPWGRNTFFEVPILFLHLCSEVCRCHTKVKCDSIYKMHRTVSGIWQVLKKNGDFPPLVMTVLRFGVTWRGLQCPIHVRKPICMEACPGVR